MIKKLIERPIKMKSLEEDKNATNYRHKIFNYRHEIGEFKYIDIKDLINKIRNNTISEISIKKETN